MQSYPKASDAKEEAPINPDYLYSLASPEVRKCVAAYFVTETPMVYSEGYNGADGVRKDLNYLINEQVGLLTPEKFLEALKQDNIAQDVLFTLLSNKTKIPLNLLRVVLRPDQPLSATKMDDDQELSNQGKSLLQRALLNRHYKIINYFFEVDKKDQTLLSLYDDTELGKILFNLLRIEKNGLALQLLTLRPSINKECVGRNNNTSLHVCLLSEIVPARDLFVRLFANNPARAAENDDKESALLIAAKKDYFDLIKAVASNSGVIQDHSAEQFFKIVNILLGKKQLQLVDQLIATRNESYLELFYQAVKANHFMIAEYFIKSDKPLKGHDLEVKESDGVNQFGQAIVHLANNNQVALAEKLMAKQPNQPIEILLPLLKKLEANHQIEMAELLLKKYQGLPSLEKVLRNRLFNLAESSREPVITRHQIKAVLTEIQPNDINDRSLVLLLRLYLRVHEERHRQFASKKDPVVSKLIQYLSGANQVFTDKEIQLLQKSKLGKDSLIKRIVDKFHSVEKLSQLLETGNKMEQGAVRPVRLVVKGRSDS